MLQGIIVHTHTNESVHFSTKMAIKHPKELQEFRSCEVREQLIGYMSSSLVLPHSSEASFLLTTADYGYSKQHFPFL